jgi:hypothetical protein
MSFPHFLAQIADPTVSSMSNDILRRIYDEAIERYHNPDRKFDERKPSPPPSEHERDTEEREEGEI